MRKRDVHALDLGPGLITSFNTRLNIYIKVYVFLVILIIIYFGAASAFAQSQQETALDSENIIHNNFSKINESSINNITLTNAVSSYEVTTLSERINKINNTVQDIDKQYFNPLINIFYTLTIDIFAKLIIIPLFILFIIIRLRPYIFRRPELIFDSFTNGTCNAELDKVLIGLRQQYMEKLTDSMDLVKDQLNAHGEDVNRKDPMPLPKMEDAAERTIGSLAASLSELTPPHIKLLVSLVDVLSTPRGIRLSCILQGCGNKPGNVGITLKIADMSKKQSTMIHTIWASKEIENERAERVTSYEQDTSLLKLGANWMALEISRMFVIEDIQRRYKFHRKNKKRYDEAYVYNFFAYLNLSFPLWGHPDFYKLAKDNFDMAIDLYEDWFQPYENLGDTYSLWGQDPKNEEDDLQDKAIIQYEKALNKMNYMKSLSGEEKVGIGNRIKISMALAHLLTDEHDQIIKAKEMIENIVKVPTYIEEEVDARSLYNIACWYALAKSEYKQTEQDHITKMSHIYLAYSLVRDRDKDLWSQIDVDPDLENVRPLDKLKKEIMPLIEDRSLINSPQKMDSKMKEILQNLELNSAKS